MPDAEVPRDRGLHQQILKLVELADRPPYLKVAITENGDAGGVVAAVLELSESVDQDIRRIQITNVT